MFQQKAGRHVIASIILAGGKGTRIRDLYPDTPKPFIQINGKPFIEWVILHLRQQGVTRVVISLGHLSAVAKEYLQTREKDDVKLTSVVEDEPLGTAGAFLFAARSVAEYEVYLVTNGDSVVLADLAPAFKMLEAEGTDAVIVGVEVGDASRFGSMVVDDNMRLLRFAEKCSGRGIINAGIYFIKKRLLDRFPANVPLSFETDVFPFLLANDAVIMVDLTAAPFLDIGTKDSIKLGEAFIDRNFGRGLEE